MSPYCLLFHCCMAAVHVAQNNKKQSSAILNQGYQCFVVQRYCCSYGLLFISARVVRPFVPLWTLTNVHLPAKWKPSQPCDLMRQSYGRGSSTNHKIEVRCFCKPWELHTYSTGSPLHSAIHHFLTHPMRRWGMRDVSSNELRFILTCPHSSQRAPLSTGPLCHFKSCFYNCNSSLVAAV